jgi:crotonobetainyl-CoA:carnitine CoA-transferase CaiB-like acyl-CoA transferase
MYPLEGLRVLEMSDSIAVSHCTLLMAGFGAEVIKVEPPASEGMARSATYTQEDVTDSMPSLFMALNRGKQGITVDLRKSEGVDIILDLARKTDVIVEGFSPTGFVGPGLSLADLGKQCPQLIVTSITDFGRTGPYRDFCADELTLNALGGFVYGVGDPDREPLGGPGIQSQMLSGVCGYIATLVALFSRELSGLGQHIDISMQEVVASTLEYSLTLANYSGWVWSRSGGRRTVSYHPLSNYMCEDGYINITVVEDYQWRLLCEVLGLPELGSDARFKTAKARIENADELDCLISGRLAALSREAVFAQTQARGVVTGPVNDVSDLLHSSQLKARRFFAEAIAPGKRVHVTRAPFLMDGTPWIDHETVPRLGEHNHEVFSSLLGKTAAQIAELEMKGVI